MRLLRTLIVALACGCLLTQASPQSHGHRHRRQHHGSRSGAPKIVSFWNLAYYHVDQPVADELPPLDVAKVTTDTTTKKNDAGGTDTKTATTATSGEEKDSADDGKSDDTKKSDSKKGDGKGADDPPARADPPKHDSWIESLNALLGKKGEPDVISRVKQGVISIEGTEDQVYDAKAVIAKYIDLQYPQVRLEVWPIQVNQLLNNAKPTEQRMRVIRRGIAIARDFARLYQIDLQRVADRARDNPFADQILRQQMEAVGIISPGSAGFDDLRHRTRSLAETFLLLACSDVKEAEWNDIFQDNSLKYLFEQLAALEDFSGAKTLNAHGLYGKRERTLQRPVDRVAQEEARDVQALLMSIYEKVCNEPMRETRYVFVPENGEPAPSSANDPRFNALHTIAKFFDTYARCVPGAYRCGPKAEEVRRCGIAADRLLEYTMNAYSDDMMNSFTRPVLDWVYMMTSRGDGPSTGIDFSGKSYLVATSGLETKTFAQAHSSYPYTPPMKITDLLGAMKSTQTAAADVKAVGSLGFFPEMLLSLAAAQPATSYTHVAPGIAMAVVPVVTPDAGSARLDMDIHVGIEANNPDDQSTGPANLDFIRSQKLQTDVDVTPFDLFELSTFAAQHTSLGDVSWRIPILEGIPILGSMFRGPRRIDTHHQEATLFCNVTIIPRARDLVHNYTSFDITMGK